MGDAGHFRCDQRVELAAPSMGNPAGSAANMADHLLAGDWNPFAGVHEHVGFTGSAAPSYGVGIGHIQSCHRFTGGNNISEIVSTFPFSEHLQIADHALAPTDLPTINVDHDVMKDDKGKKRKMQAAEDEHKKDVPPDANKPKTEHKGGGKSRKYSASKQANEDSSNGDASKDDYAHIRAKRGQATNSHSLAERLRREKISERMRFLQDLVPGCSKITGKALMLDEIINYVQSLQRQVEFLSMKLATIIPELNYDIERILSKDALHQQAGGSAVFQFFPGFSTSDYHQFQQPIQQGRRLTQLEVENNNPTPEEAVEQSLRQVYLLTTKMSSGWDEEFLQNVMQMGFIPGAQLDSSTTTSQQPGAMKIEQ